MTEMPTLSEGDRVRLLADKKFKGEIDETWRGASGKLYAAVIWDVSGCGSNHLLADLEEDPDA